MIRSAGKDVLLASSGLHGRNIIGYCVELQWVDASCPLSQVPRKSKPPLVYVVQVPGWRFQSQLFSQMEDVLKSIAARPPQFFWSGLPA